MLLHLVPVAMLKGGCVPPPRTMRTPSRPCTSPPFCRPCQCLAAALCPGPFRPARLPSSARGQQAGLRGTSGMRMRARCSRCLCCPPLVRALHLCLLCRGRFSGLDLCYSESCLPTMASQNNWAECGLDDTCVSTDGASVGDTVAGYGTWDAGESDGFSHWFRSTPTAPDGVAANIMSFPSGRLGTYTVNP